MSAQQRQSISDQFPEQTLPAGYRRCTKCAAAAPNTNENFPTHTNGGNFCRKCVREKEREKRHRKDDRQKEAAAALADKAIKAITGGQLASAPHITEYLDEMVRQVGGLKTLVSRHLDQVHKAEEARPGSQTVLKFYEHIGKLILYSTQHRATAPDAHSLTDDELAEELRDTMIAVLMQKISKDADPAKVLQLFTPSSEADDAEEADTPEEERD